MTAALADTSMNFDNGRTEAFLQIMGRCLTYNAQIYFRYRTQLSPSLIKYTEVATLRSQRNFQGGDPVKFRLINDAYNRLIAHVDKLQRMEMEAELRFESQPDFDKLIF